MTKMVNVPCVCKCKVDPAGVKRMDYSVQKDKRTYTQICCGPLIDSSCDNIIRLIDARSLLNLRYVKARHSFKRVLHKVALRNTT
jgi:hypothetical protein